MGIFLNPSVLMNLNSIIPLSCHLNRKLNISLNLRILFWVWIIECNPLVLHQVIFSQVNCTQVKDVLSNHRIFENTLVHQFHNNLRCFHISFIYASRFYEYMLVPYNLSLTSYFLFWWRILFQSQAIY